MVIPREHLMTYIGKARLKDARYKWLIEDVMRLFRYHEKLVYHKGEKFATLYLSRSRFPNDAFRDEMKDENRVVLLKKKGISSAIIKELPSEKAIVSKLAKVTHGLESF